MLKTKEKELIEELKRLRLERGFTYQEIADKTEENDEPVSLSTIKLVFSDRDTHQHDYKRVLKPIANVLLPFEEVAPLLEAAAPETLFFDTLEVRT